MFFLTKSKHANSRVYMKVTVIRGGFGWMEGYESNARWHDFMIQ
jgi:hypothetical protein